MQGSKRPGDPLQDPNQAKRTDTVSEITFRFLCPTSKAGNVIGKAGQTINHLRQATGCWIKIEETYQGCTERVIRISGKDVPEAELAPSQDALLQVLDAVFQDEKASDSLAYTAKLVVDHSQVGHIMGKGGATVRELKSRSGADIQISKTALPWFALPTDELMQITGTHSAVRSALQMVSQKMREKRPRHVDFGPKARSELAGSMVGAHGLGVSAAVSGYVGTVHTTLQLLIPSNRAGHVIGRGGTAVRNIRQTTGAMVKIHDVVENCADRLVQLDSEEPCASPYCAALEALFRIASCMLPADTDRLHIRLLLPVGYAGVIVGKNGGTIVAMQQQSGASIAVHAPTFPHPLAEPGQQILEVEGTCGAVIAALQLCGVKYRAHAAHEQCKPATATPPVVLPAPTLIPPSSAAAVPSSAAVANAINVQSPDSDASRHSPNSHQSASAVTFLTAEPALPLISSDMHAWASPAKGLEPSPPPTFPAEANTAVVESQLPYKCAHCQGMRTCGFNDVIVNSHPAHVCALVAMPPGCPPVPPAAAALAPVMEAGIMPAAVPLPGAVASSTCVLQIWLDNSQVGAVVGRAGSKINQIRQSTGAWLKLHDASNDKTSKRMLEIIGTFEQCTTAQYMVVSFLRAASAASIALQTPIPVTMPMTPTH